MNTIAHPINKVKNSIATQSSSMNPVQKSLVVGGIAASLLLFFYLAATQPMMQPVLLLIGLALGFTLFHARFGFTSAFRRMMSVGNGQAMRAHMLMLAVAVTLSPQSWLLAYRSSVLIQQVMFRRSE